MSICIQYKKGLLKTKETFETRLKWERAHMKFKNYPKLLTIDPF